MLKRLTALLCLMAQLVLLSCTAAAASLPRYFCTHPEVFSVVPFILFAELLFLSLSIQSVRNNQIQKQISRELALALNDAKQANDAKQNFFSKMSHDIRTPMNVVLGMTQVAQKYKNDMPRLERALDNIATELLKTLGFQVTWAENGKLGVETFAASRWNQYFAVFMDMQMPVMDGLEGTRQIRSINRPDHNVPIFAMTANTFTADRDRCREAGMNGYIPKPVSVKDIQAALRQISA